MAPKLRSAAAADELTNGRLPRGASRATADAAAAIVAIAEADPVLRAEVDRLLDRPSLVTAEVIAKRYGLPVKSVLAYARARRLPCVRIGRHVRFDPRAVDEAIRNGRV